MILISVLLLKLCFYTVFTPVFDSKEFINSADISIFSAEKKLISLDVIEAEIEEIKDDSEQETDAAFLLIKTFINNCKGQPKFYLDFIQKKYRSSRTVLRYILYCTWME